MSKIKKRIFIVNDASFLDTGYGIYGKEILTRLHNSDKFEVAELGCYCDINNPKIKNIPWKFYANAVGNADPRSQNYHGNTLNQFGLWRFDRCLLDFRPHIVFDIRDYWMFAYQETSPLKKYFHWIIMPATDSAPPKTEWLYTYANADIVVPYTEWAKKTLNQYGGNQINLFPKIANAGINPEEFYPIENKTNHKIKYFGKDVSVTGLVMRNQKRKLFPDILLAYKKYLTALQENNQDELYEKSILYLHTSYPEESGWNFPSLLLEFGLLDKTYFTYNCNKCKHFFPSKFQSSVTICPNCKIRSAPIASPSHGLTTPQLNEVYNLFDLFIQYAICEGFGMPQVEAAACGLQIASVDYSAMTEIVENLNGIKIPVKRMFRELETNADRAYPDINATVKILYDFFVNTSDDTKKQNQKIIRDKCINQYTWDNVYKVWEECFDSVDINKKISWDADIDPVNTSLKVPNNLNNQEYITYICNSIINSPELINTSQIQCLIRDADSGLITRNKQTIVLTRQHITEHLEMFLNNKHNVEMGRKDPSILKKEDFLS
jgi:glycosyltransferase involved in cell wall biosynthesis